jgi:hypothetical protein
MSAETGVLSQFCGYAILQKGIIKKHGFHLVLKTYQLDVD